MEHPSPLAFRIREVFLDGRWIANTNYQALLSDVPYSVAVRTIGSLNSIAALTYHIRYYLLGVLRVLEGGPLDIRDRYSFDLPALNREEDWAHLKNTLFAGAAAFAQAVEQMPEGKLDSAFIDPQYGTYRRNIEGLIEHSYYHLGQISLIKKQLMGD
jgi:uncharacterized damage-inducible protein DinB